MHTTELGTANVPAFLTKLWKLVEDPVYNDLISWSPNGRSFVIKNQSRFSKELLPLYFKHNNMASFIRQLNMYGFRKLTNIENSGLKTDKDEMEFYHQCFIKDQEGLLEFIKRKIKQSSLLKASLQVSAVAKAPESGSNSRLEREDVKDMLSDMKAIRDRQDTTDSALINMQRENEALWREIAILRQKHQKQQQIVDKLIHFLVTLVSNRNGFLKRKVPLMIENDGEPETAKRPRINSVSGNSVTGPVIHDVTDDVLEEDLEEGANESPIITNMNAGDGSPVNLDDSSSQETSPFDPLGTEVNPLIFSNDTNESLSILDPLETLVAENGLTEANINNLPSVAAVPDSAAIVPLVAALKQEVTNSQISQLLNASGLTSNSELTSSLVSGNLLPNLTKAQERSFSRDTFCEQLDGIETQLNWLQDQLSFGGLNLEQNALSGVGFKDTISQLFTMENMGNSNMVPSTSNAILGNEMTKFQPSADVGDSSVLSDIDFAAMVNEDDPNSAKDSVGDFDLDVESMLSAPKNSSNGVNNKYLGNSLTTQ
ncbi:Heat shock factor protein 1 [Halotydeus destructor]|nr:Heat shock factor protein 1 [Halotydeus destructor]